MILEGEFSFSAVWFRNCEKEKGEERELPSASFFDPRSFACRNFIEPRVKVHLLDEGYVWVPKRRDFTEDPKEEVSGNKNNRD